MRANLEVQTWGYLGIMENKVETTIMGYIESSRNNAKLFTSSIPTLKPLLHKKCNVSLPPLNCLPCSTANALQEI